MSFFLNCLALLLSLYFLHVWLYWRNRDQKGGVKIMGTVVVKKKRAIDLTDLRASIIDRVYEFFGRGITFQLVSATAKDPDDEEKAMVGEPAYLEGWIYRLTSYNAGDARYNVTFNWEEKHRIPGAIIVKNFHRYEFKLKTLTLRGVPGRGRMHFVCNSWVYPAHKYSCDRIFFANDTYLPSNTPGPLKKYREKELEILRGVGTNMDATNREFQEHDRIYDYDAYNDLGDPSMGDKYKRDDLGVQAGPAGVKPEGTPYPRRGRTGPPGVKGEYLPRDEYFQHLKSSDFYAYLFKSIIKTWLLSKLRGKEFTSFNDVKKLYGKSRFSGVISWLAGLIPFEFFREAFRTDGEPLIKFPLPQVIINDDDNSAWWKTDKEFARQMLAGLNPVLLRAAKDNEIHDFDQNKQKLQMSFQDNEIHDFDQNKQKLQMSFKAINCSDADRGFDRRYFVLDHSYIKNFHDEIAKHSESIVYASKTLLYLEDDGTLTPMGISLISKNEHGQYEEDYYFPAKDGVEGGLWMLAKAFVVVNDSGYHQLISHWLYTHAVIEPFAIASNRQLSVMHPIHKLLSPHFRDTMKMNNMARHKLVNAGGIIESTFFTGSFAMQFTSEVYKHWNLMDHALPTDLLNRGVAAEDDSKHNKIRLLIEDYPYAVDGLEVWSKIETWVRDYCCIYYRDDAGVQSDVELQGWWTEVREVGHGDLKEKTWWPKMNTRKDLIDSCSIIIWLASAFHAAVNFGQYAYAGYVPNRPTFIRKPMPTEEDEKMKLEKNPVGYFLETITSKDKSLQIMAVLQILSRHSSEEIYLGQRGDREWTSDLKAQLAFEEFYLNLLQVERNIEERNWDKSLKNRNGDVRIPYTLLHPNTSGECVPGLHGKGIPNSISI